MGFGIRTRVRKVWWGNPTVFQIRSGYARLRSSIDGKDALRSMLIVSDGTAYCSEQMFAPIRRSAGGLRDAFNLVVHHVDTAAALAMNDRHLSQYMVVGLQLDYRRSESEAQEIVEELSRQIDGRAQLVYFDGDDDINIQWPRTMRYFDLYVKKHIFSNLQHYTNTYIGKSNLTDYICRTHGISFEDYPTPTSGPVAESDLSKIYLGWNIALDDQISKVVRSISYESSVKDNDIVCRAFVPKDEWKYWLRTEVTERLTAMSDRVEVIAPTARVAPREYFKEMLRSRICVSPFGAGEICWREFEAMLCGCLVVKPDMSHLRTEPNLFVAGETYVPCRWDYSDLEEVCLRYLADDNERLRIAARAKEVLNEALCERWFLDRFGGLLDRLGVLTSDGAERRLSA